MWDFLSFPIETGSCFKAKHPERCFLLVGKLKRPSPSSRGACIEWARDSFPVYKKVGIRKFFDNNQETASKSSNIENYSMKLTRRIQKS